MRIANTFIKPSKIHGLGLFAKCDIKKGAQIVQGLAQFDEHMPEWIAYVKEWKVKSFAHNNGYCMVNHSETPNTKRGKEDRIIASENIKKGTEITEDYYKLPDNENPFVGLDLQKIIYEYKSHSK